MIWLVGAQGMLGTEVGMTLDAGGMPWVGTDREVDITSPQSLRAFAGGKDIHWIVNCAAYTAVDRAEEEPDSARALNADGPGNLAVLARGIGARILHISTDYVFSGFGDRPYREDDPVAPAGVYARSKAEGETAVLAACDRSIILRTAWLFGKFGNNFVYTMLRLMRLKPELRIVADQRGAPTWAGELSLSIARMIQASESQHGIYHLTGSGETNWYEFAVEIHRLGRERGILERDCILKPITTEEYPTAARRPAYSVLSTEKIARDYGIVPRPWMQSLEDFFDQAFADAVGFERIGIPSREGRRS